MNTLSARSGRICATFDITPAMASTAHRPAGHGRQSSLVSQGCVSDRKGGRYNLACQNIGSVFRSDLSTAVGCKMWKSSIRKLRRSLLRAHNRGRISYQRVYPLEQDGSLAASFSFDLDQHDSPRRTTARRPGLVHLGWPQSLLYLRTEFAKGKKPGAPSMDCSPRR